MTKCERCTGTCSWSHDTTRLIDGIMAHLCTVCIRDWTTCLDTEAVDDWAEHVRLEAQYAWLQGRALAGQPPEMWEWHNLSTERDVNRQALHAHGLAFLAQTVDRVDAEAYQQKDTV